MKINKEHCTAEIVGSIKSVSRIKKDGKSLLNIVVEYMVSGQSYEISEDIDETVYCPATHIDVDQTVKLKYNPHGPQTAYLIRG